VVQDAGQALARKVEFEAEQLERRVKAVWENRDNDCASSRVDDVGTPSLSLPHDALISHASATKPVIDVSPLNAQLSEAS
jgi:hypothetical protein